MNCDAFEGLLHRFAAGDLETGERQACQEHLQRCPRCAHLARVVSGQVDPLPSEEALALTSSVLEKTSGPACDRVKGLLGELLEGRLDAALSERVEGHLRHCSSCGVVATVLRSLSFELAGLAELEPDVDFTENVLALTSRRTRSRDKFADWGVSWNDRVRTWWRYCLDRPLFSWEAAYVGALVLLLLVGGPFSVVQGLLARPLTAVESGLRARAASTSSSLADSWEKTVREADGFRVRIRVHFSAKEATVEKSLLEAGKRAVDFSAILLREGRDLGERAGSLVKEFLEALRLESAREESGQS